MRHTVSDIFTYMRRDLLSITHLQIEIKSHKKIKLTNNETDTEQQITYFFLIHLFVIYFFGFATGKSN